jgi:nucleoside-diphosphate-sugar epimerase
MARFLAKNGEEVFLYDQRPRRLEYLDDVERSLRFLSGDVMDLPRLVEVFREHANRIEGIVHTVGVMGEFVAENPHRNVKLNIMGTLNLLEMARQFGIGRVLYVSTGAVYGAIEGIANEQDHQPAPADLYSATKAASESLGQQYAGSFGLDFRVGRVYFIYGPGKLPSTFVRLYRLAFGALEGLQDLQADRGADQSLDFTYVEDAARGLVMLYEAKDPPHRIYNIATGAATSVGEVAGMTSRWSASGARARIGPGTLMPRCEALDISRARKELGFEPEVSLEEGIRLYDEWVRAQMKNTGRKI